MFVLIVTSLPVFSLVFWCTVVFRCAILLHDQRASCCCTWDLFALHFYAQQVQIVPSTRRFLPTLQIWFWSVEHLFVHLAPSLLYSSSVYGDQLGSLYPGIIICFLLIRLSHFYGVLKLPGGEAAVQFLIWLITWEIINKNWITQHWLPVSLLVQAAS